MDLEEATQCTQNTPGAVDPRRMGRNNSGLSTADISDVMCILHPCSPAAFNVVASNAQRNANYVLQNDGFQAYNDVLTQAEVEEHETFILDPEAPHQAMDLALRFSVKTKNPELGFTFGRHPDWCDIVLANDQLKRVSNLHFSIFMNDSGVLMVQDMSTNGTIVDDIVLRGKIKTSDHPQTRMLNPGSIIQILSPRTEDIVKFIVRIPSREGHIEEYEAKFQAHMRYKAAAKPRTDQDNIAHRRLADVQMQRQHSGSVKAPLVRRQHGMHWSGGDRYNVVGLIGQGAFATVYQLATKSDGLLFAAKELEKRRFMKNGILDRKLDNEMKIMKAISHDNIVQYVDYYDHTQHMYIIMEFVPCGDLSKYLSAQEKPLSDAFAKSMATQVFDALAYLHKKKITHRDIKPDNILLANLDTFTVKLSDFGLSKVVTDNETFLKTFCGTLLYCAPEVFPHYDNYAGSKGRKRTRQAAHQQSMKFHGYSQSVDIWSFGAVLWYSLCLKPPFEGVNEGPNGRGMFDKIMLTPLNTSDLANIGVADDAIALLVEMLNTDPALRPSPVSCLHHRWLGIEHTTVVDVGADDNGLVAIAEEEEADAEEVDEPDFSSLSLDEQESNDGSHLSEVSIHSGSLDFLDPRQSKRFKSDMSDYRDNRNHMVDSSPDIFYQSIPIIHQPQTEQAATVQSQPARRKLFGEISQSALESSAVLGRNPIDAVEMSKTSEDGYESYDSLGNYESAQNEVQGGLLASSGLFGAESMVREFHMDSPQSANSQGAEPTEPVTPDGADGRGPVSGSHVNGKANKIQDDDITPRQPQRAVFSRQINIPIPASFYYEADDPSTHNVEYASKVSGFDYVSNPTYLPPIEGASLPTTVSGSATEDETEQDNVDIAAPLLTSTRQIELSPSPSQFIKPPPRLGKLASTPDSFTSVNINLSNRISTWGRLQSNTHVYPDPHDVRVPKTGIIIMFHAKGIGEFAEDDQAWLRLPDLHCVICTESTQSIYVNGVLLKKSEPGKRPYGKIYTGDEVVVTQSHNSRPGLKFTCEFYHGEAKQQRPENAAGFVVEVEGSARRSSRRERSTS